MQVKLRQVGNSVGMLVPASELKRLSIGLGDTVELEITKLVREGWDAPEVWEGADIDVLSLQDLSHDFDSGVWQW